MFKLTLYHSLNLDYCIPILDLIMFPHLSQLVLIEPLLVEGSTLQKKPYTHTPQILHKVLPTSYSSDVQRHENKCHARILTLASYNYTQPTMSYLLYMMAACYQYSLKHNKYYHSNLLTGNETKLGKQSKTLINKKVII